MTAQFHVPPTIVVGGGARREVVAQLQRHGVTRVLPVTDEGMLRLEPGREVEGMLTEAAIDVRRFADVPPDPTDRNARDGLAQFRADRCEAIVAVGGGSPIDAAKAISILVTNTQPLSQYAGNHRVPLAGVPLNTIPTAAGTRRGCDFFAPGLVPGVQRLLRYSKLSGNPSSAKAVEPPTRGRWRITHNLGAK